MPKYNTNFCLGIISRYIKYHARVADLVADFNEQTGIDKYILTDWIQYDSKQWRRYKDYVRDLEEQVQFYEKYSTNVESIMKDYVKNQVKNWKCGYTKYFELIK